MEWEAQMVDIHFQKYMWMYCAGYAAKREMAEQIGWMAKQP